jgi:hypothetical protein
MADGHARLTIAKGSEIHRECKHGKRAVRRRHACDQRPTSGHCRRFSGSVSEFLDRGPALWPVPWRRSRRFLGDVLGDVLDASRRWIGDVLGDVLDAFSATFSTLSRRWIGAPQVQAQSDVISATVAARSTAAR